MEAAEEPITSHSCVESVLVDNSNLPTVLPMELGDCGQANGVVETITAAPKDEADTVIIQQVDIVSEIESIPVPDTNKNDLQIQTDSSNANSKPVVEPGKTQNSELMITNDKSTVENQVIEEPVVDVKGEEQESESAVAHEVEIDESTDDVDNTQNVSGNVNVTFETEILVEKNYDNEIKTEENDKTNNILNELGHNIGLSEALCSADSVENSENNNSENNKHQVLNNEELLDILEGNDELHDTETVIAFDHPNTKSLEKQLAMQQLSRLSKKKKYKQHISTIDKHVNKSTVVKMKQDLIEGAQEKFKSSIDNCESKEPVLERDSKETNNHKNNLDVKYVEINIDTKEYVENESEVKKLDVEENKIKKTMSENLLKRNKSIRKPSETKITSHKAIKKNKKKENIVNVLVQDWSDDEPMEDNESNSSLVEATTDLNTSEIIQNQDSISKTLPGASLADIEHSDKLGKEDKESQSQRRQSRVIKKKVIFDPDNPDTFTKGMTVIKSKSDQSENEVQPAKKIKIEHSLQKAKLKSQTTKMKWKKPTPKSNKQIKRLTEVDRLLMDEGAVNMIYQLTPEAPKGKKNVRTKAEFIKRIQSSTPDGTEMKFRERKKESKEEEAEAKKILGGKHRMSLSSSVKSPSVYEDFETHSADDSIIYRRHSSSSYSSTGMSPRRLSEVDLHVSHSSTGASQKPASHAQVNKMAENSSTFMSDLTDTSTNEMIRKEDCVSIKEKLNSKLSLALQKKKRESTSNEKSSKRKKIQKLEEQQKSKYVLKYEHLAINIDNRLAEICIRKAGAKQYNVETLKELESALEYIDKKDDISLTLLTSQCGSLCSDLDLRHLLIEDSEKRTHAANEIAEAVRSLLCKVEEHSKLLCTGIWGTCSGIGLAIMALSDMAIASEHATFSFGSHSIHSQTPPIPGIAALTAQKHWPKSVINDLVMFGRRLAASEALKSGLLSRVLWPNRFVEQLRALVADIAAQPPQSMVLKKKLLRLNSTPESKITFLTSMEAERDMLAEYWTSVEGQEMLRAYYDID